MNNDDLIIETEFQINNSETVGNIHVEDPRIIAKTFLPFTILITLTVPISTWDIIAIKTTADHNMMLTSKLNIK